MVLTPTSNFRSAGRKTAPQRRAPKAKHETFDLGPLQALIGFKIHMLDLLIYQLYYERLDKATMTPGMFSTLSVVKANPGVRQGALADALLIQRPNMTLLVNRLARAGYIDRRAARGDNRGIELFVRAEGEKALQRLAAKLAAHEHALTEALTEAERARLGSYLARMMRALSARPRRNGRAAAKPARG
ncbi:MAG TPA: MarR family winged helix-turn-helix transcriptional regulator [Stellaceae bacterium]|nr:MarR family winged helix-turn-helix transcriptional regulator [Stellaceae bacterium]